MSEYAIAPVDRAPIVAPASRIESDDAFVDAYLAALSSPETRVAYSRDVGLFRAFVAMPLRHVTRLDVEDFKRDLMAELAVNSVRRRLGCVKSLLGFARDTGYMPFNVAAAVKVPKAKNTLAERIIDAPDVHVIIASEPNMRNQAILRMLYASGGRCSEVCNLAWKDLQPRGDRGGQVTFFGKGDKTRAVPLTPSTWKVLARVRRGAGADDPVFLSGKGGFLSRQQLWRIVKAAGVRCGCPDISPHWFRHSHATHSLDAGCPPHVLQATLGHSSLEVTSKYIHARPDEGSSLYLGM